MIELLYTMIRKTILILVLLSAITVNAEKIRREITPEYPMWLVHIDRSYGEDPQKCINAVPDDIRKYVVFNISVTSADKRDFIEQCLNVCADNDVFAMVQCSAGSRNSMSDTDLTEYKDLYQKYPNLIGYNFCEQGWGFNTETLKQRLELFAGLLELADQFGGYLYVNDEHSIANNPINTIAKQKASDTYFNAAKKYSKNFIYGYKTTMGYGYYDNESACLGMFLSGLCDQYAIRFDQYAWSYSGKGKVFGDESDSTISNSLAWFSCPESVSGIMIVENMMMQGATVVDGPEIPIISCMFDGRTTPQFKNVICDIFRKFDEGAFTIPCRDDVRNATKFAYICNRINTVDDTLYEGLYQMDDHRDKNKNWLKKTGRYPTIPTLAKEPDKGLFDFVVSQKGSNSYASRWGNNEMKLAELEKLFPLSYSGNMYVRSSGNAILAYNPYLNTNTCTTGSFQRGANEIAFEFEPHTFAVIENSQNNVINIYLNNYRTDKSALWDKYPSMTSDDGLPRMTQSSVQQYMKEEFIDNPTDHVLRKSVVKIKGCDSEPIVSIADRGDHQKSSLSAEYNNGIITIEITHNGPVDISVDLGLNSIESIETDQPEAEATGIYYDLTGRRIVNPTHGLYIHNGNP